MYLLNACLAFTLPYQFPQLDSKNRRMAMDISDVSSIPFPDPNDVQTLVSVTHPPNKTIKSGGIYPFPKVWNRWPGARLYGGWVDSWFLTKKNKAFFFGCVENSSSTISGHEHILQLEALLAIDAVSKYLGKVRNKPFGSHGSYI